MNMCGSSWQAKASQSTEFVWIYSNAAGHFLISNNELVRKLIMDEDGRFNVKPETAS